MTNEERQFWYRVEDVIRDSGMTKTAIAEKAGTAAFNLRYKEGGGMMSARTMAKFCRATGVSADFLLGLIDTPKREIVHCKDCVNRCKFGDKLMCSYHGDWTIEDDYFCSEGWRDE